jgi:hypothetical protein
MALLLELHNAHLEYERRQNRVTTLRLRRVLKKIRDISPEWMREVQRIQNQINEETKENFHNLQKLRKGNKDE